MVKKIDRFEIKLKRIERRKIFRDNTLERRKKISERRHSFRSLYNEYSVLPKRLKEKRNLNVLEFFKQDWADLMKLIKRKYGKNN